MTSATTILALPTPVADVADPPPTYGYDGKPLDASFCRNAGGRENECRRDIENCDRKFDKLRWPPTDHNLKLWAANLGLPNQLASYEYQLEGGILVRTWNDTLSDGKTITLHGGPLHAVFTLRGGPLGGINYGTQYNLASMAKIVALQLTREADEGIIEDMK